MESFSLPASAGLALPRSRRLLRALSDDRLVDQVRRGNDAAFEVVYDRHSRGVLAFCRHLLGSREEAEDAVQQTFMSAYSDLQRSDRAVQLKAWLYTIARNRSLSMLRARREQPAEDLDRVDDGLSEQVQGRADLRELLADVRELPYEQRAALVLSEVSDLSHADIAAVLDTKPARVKSLVFQARSALIERRTARDTPCAEIREQVATLRGGSLRRGHLRRHLESCPGCAAFRQEVKRQRQMLAVALPVLPSLGLKEAALAAVGIGTSSAGIASTGASGIAAGIAAKAGTAKIAAIAVLATGGTVAGGVAVSDRAQAPTPAPRAAAGAATPRAGSVAARSAATARERGANTGRSSDPAAPDRSPGVASAARGRAAAAASPGDGFGAKRGRRVRPAARARRRESRRARRSADRRLARRDAARTRRALPTPTFRRSTATPRALRRAGARRRAARRRTAVRTPTLTAQPAPPPPTSP